MAFNSKTFGDGVKVENYGNGNVSVTGDYLENTGAIDSRLCNIRGRVCCIFRDESGKTDVRLQIGGANLSGYEAISPAIASAKNHPNFPKVVDEIVLNKDGKIIIFSDGNYGVDILPNGEVQKHHSTT
ncbi:MAG: hypothetical protein WC774_03560 [Candidatus Gracilibacteria bacterium]